MKKFFYQEKNQVWLENIHAIEFSGKMYSLLVNGLFLFLVTDSLMLVINKT